MRLELMLGLRSLSGVRLGTFIMALVGSGAAFMLRPILPIFLREHIGASVSEVGLAVSISSFAAIPSPILSGLLSRKVSPSRILPLSFLLTITSSFFMANTKDLWFATLLLTFFNGGFMIVVPSCLSIITLTTEAKERDEAIALFLISFGLGMGLGPALTSGSVFLLGIRGTFLMAALTSLLGLAAAFYTVQKTRGLEMKRNSPKRDFRSILGNIHFLGASTAMSAWSFCVSPIQTFSPIYVRESFGFGEAQVALLFLGFALMSICSRFTVAKMVKWFGHWRILIICLILLTSASFAMSLIPSAPLYYLGFMVLGMTNGYIFPVHAMIINRSVQPSVVSLANGVDYVALNIGNFVSVASVSGVAQSMGIPAAIAAASLAPLIGIFVAAYASKSGRLHSV